jgi:hypothetical protein
MLELAIADEVAVPPEDACGEVEVWREHGEVCAYGYQARGHNWLYLPGRATFRFLRGDEPVLGIPAGSAGQLEVRDAFERTALPLALQSLGRQVLHASAVQGSTGVVAFCGDSGTGKSTLAYAAWRRGHRLWADDAVAFEIVGQDVRAIPLPFRLILRAESSAFFGVEGDSSEQSMRAAAEAARLATVVILDRAVPRGFGVDVEQLSGADAFAAALAQGYCYRPSQAAQSERMVAEYLELAARVPIVRARFEPRFESVDVLLDRIEVVLEHEA